MFLLEQEEEATVKNTIDWLAETWATELVDFMTVLLLTVLRWFLSGTLVIDEL